MNDMILIGLKSTRDEYNKRVNSIPSKDAKEDNLNVPPSALDLKLEPFGLRATSG